MSSLMARIREWLGVGATHDAEHDDLRADVTEQQIAVRGLQAYAKARTIRDRRRVVALEHPDRRATD